MRNFMIPLTAAASLLGVPHAALSAQSARAELTGTAGQKVGVALFTEAPGGVLVRLETAGVPPGWHGVHLHEVGDCSKRDFTSAGGHVHSMPSHVHGLLNPAGNEAGDLPNLYVGADGVGRAEYFTSLVSLDGASGRAKLLDADGSALVVHAGADDHTTQPIGGAGARIACGVIR